MTEILKVDAVVVGGGLVGSAIAFGLMEQGLSTALLDEGDVAFRASRGNFGLVWVQGKGDGRWQYAHWSRRSADLWPGFAEDLKALSGVDVEYEKPGGYYFTMSEAEHVSRTETLERMRREVPGGYDFEMMKRNQLLNIFPGLGEDVFGASWCPHDGHANPLYLLRAFHAAMKGRVRYLPGVATSRISREGGSFRVEAGTNVVLAEKVVLASGLGNKALAPMVGLRAEVNPLKGQILVTERLAPKFGGLTLNVRQTADGTVMIGDSHEDAGFHTEASVDIGKSIAARAMRQFPALGQAGMIRQWAALRIMSPDGYPIYEQSATQPGAFVVNCHSGVTLAAAHARSLAVQIAAGQLDPLLEPFNGGRFEERQ
ncbi:MAG: dependent oxidoreductase [Cereibacter sp.]|jgi:glycine/D-amino acid oxidase-like deaminating enzyme|nr:dependent oxidoreductase [Cereibacter sp.]